MEAEASGKYGASNVAKNEVIVACHSKLLLLSFPAALTIEARCFVVAWHQINNPQ
jgi:hypothetical protein